MAERDGSIKSVLKGLDILEHLAAAGGPVSVSQVGRAKGFHVTTAHRLLRTLALRGYVAQESGNHAYRLGSRVLHLSRAYLESRDVVAIARPRLEALRDALGETIHLAVYSDGEVVELAQALSRQPISASTRPGHRSPAYCTALGKVLLAELPPAELEGYLGKATLDKRAPRTITGPRALARELERVRSRGWATDEEEFAAKLCCVAVPVRDALGVAIAAISVAMPKMRYRAAHVSRWTRRLAGAAAEISRELGFPGAEAR